MSEKMSSIRSDLCSKIHPEPIDHFDRLPNSIIFLIFNKISDVKALGRCCVVSRRFHSLVSQVDNVVVCVDCVISDENPSAAASSAFDKSRHPISSLFRLLLSRFFKPLQSLSQLVTPSQRRLTSISDGGGGPPPPASIIKSMPPRLKGKEVGLGKEEERLETPLF